MTSLESGKTCQVLMLGVRTHGSHEHFARAMTDATGLKLTRRIMHDKEAKNNGNIVRIQSLDLMKWSFLSRREAVQQGFPSPLAVTFAYMTIRDWKKRSIMFTSYGQNERVLRSRSVIGRCWLYSKQSMLRCVNRCSSVLVEEWSGLRNRRKNQ